MWAGGNVLLTLSLSFSLSPTCYHPPFFFFPFFPLRLFIFFLRKSGKKRQLYFMAMSTSSSSSSVKGKKPYKSWVKDGVNGGPSSMDILINWLANKANYARWRGSNNDGSAERIPKKILLEEIISEMQNAGIHHRLPKDVASKISTLQSNYRSAREWYDTDGKKLQQAGAKEDIIHGKKNFSSSFLSVRIVVAF